MPLVLLFLCVLSYGLLIPWLGFYWDDWPTIWISHSLGHSGLIEFSLGDRPLRGWLIALMAPLLGETPLPWHIFAFLTRWLSGVVLWWCLRGVWPERRREVACITVLFAVYPGYSLQPYPLYPSLALLTLVSFIFSMGAMIWAYRMPRLFWPLTILALPSSALNLTVSEYFVGLELLRPALLWLIISEKEIGFRPRLRRTLISWSPYLVLFGIYLSWRLFFFRSERSVTDQTRLLGNIVADPVRELALRAYTAFADVFQSSVMAWGQTFSASFFSFRVVRVVEVLFLVLISAIVVLVSLMGLSSGIASEPAPVKGVRANWPKQAIVLGLLAMVAGGLPAWFARLQVLLSDVGSRFTLALMFGACVLLAGVVHKTIKSKLQPVVFSILIGLAVGYHFRNANQYRGDWEVQKALFWQLSWRAPGLKPGTAVVIDELPLSSSRGHTLTGALNLIYAPQHSSTRLDYWFFNLSTQLGDEIPAVADRVALTDTFQTLSFVGSTSNSVTIRFSPPSCLRVLDPELDELPQLPALARAAQRISHVDQIVSGGDPVRPPSGIFGSEPRDCWCYYFEKADLARQLADWQLVAKLGDEARGKGLAPSDPTEWLPLIEAYVLVGRYEDAREIVALVSKSPPTVEAYEIQDGDKKEVLALRALPSIEPALRHLLLRLDSSASLDGARKAVIGDLRSELSRPAR
jgi:hypothetical protein